MNARHESELQLLRALINCPDDEVLPGISLDHIMQDNVRDCIERMKQGATHIDLLHTKHRDMVLSLPECYARPWQMYQIVKEHYMGAEFESAYRLAIASENPFERVHVMEKNLTRIMSGISEGRKADAAERFIQRITCDSPMIPTGISRLDNVLNGGVYPTAKVIIGARPSMGKTAFAKFIAEKMVLNGEPIDFHSIESPNDQIMRRVMSSMHGILTNNMKRSLLTDWQIEMLSNSARDMENRGLWIHNSTGMSSEQIAAEIYSSKARVAFIDHIQKFTGKELRLVIRAASGNFADVANKKDKVVFIISQLARIDGEPSMNDLKESGDLEQDADIIIFLWMKDKNYGDNLVDLCVTIAKNRDGATGFFTLKYKRDTHEFFETDYVHEPQQTNF